MLFLVICLAHAGDVLLNQKPLAWPLMTSVPGLIVVVSVLLPLLSPRSGVVFSRKRNTLATHFRPG